MGAVHVEKASIQVPNGRKSDKQAAPSAFERLLFLSQWSHELRGEIWTFNIIEHKQGKKRITE